MTLADGAASLHGTVDTGVLVSAGDKDEEFLAISFNGPGHSLLPLRIHLGVAEAGVPGTKNTVSDFLDAPDDLGGGLSE